jgi:hypothetical protein
MSKVNKHYAPHVSSMKALIIYDNLSSFMKANAALQHSAQNAGVNVLWSIRPWRVDMLKFPPTADEALTEAIDAYLIIFAGRCVQSLPFWLKDWLEQWAKYRRVEDAALAVIGAGKAEVPSSVEKSDLSECARQHGLRVLFDDRGVIEDCSPFPTGFLDKPKPPKLLILPQALDIKTLDEEYRDWGIND